MLEFVKIFGNAELAGINKEDTKQARPKHILKAVPEGEGAPKSYNDGYYYSKTEEPYLAIINVLTKSEVTFPLSEVTKAMRKIGYKLTYKKTPRPTIKNFNKKLYNKSKSVGLDYHQPLPGSAKACKNGCKHSLTMNTCSIADEVTVLRYNDGMEYCVRTKSLDDQTFKEYEAIKSSLKF